MAKACIIYGSKAVVGTCDYCGKNLCDTHTKETEAELFCPNCFGQL